MPLNSSIASSLLPHLIQAKTNVYCRGALGFGLREECQPK